MAGRIKHMERSRRSYHQKPFKSGRAVRMYSKIPRKSFIEMIRALIQRVFRTQSK